MRIVILADETIKSEFLQKPVSATTYHTPAPPDGDLIPVPNTHVIWVEKIEQLAAEKADAYMDLLFRPLPERIALLKKLLPAPVFINSVAHTVKHIGAPFIRINAWPGFLNRPIVEIATGELKKEDRLNLVMQALGWDYRLVPDEPGMIAPRVLAMIINEAHFALKEGVSTKDEIDIAMKLGTNYPLGPFEWSEKIGQERIGELLDKLSEQDERYRKAF